MKQQTLTGFEKFGKTTRRATFLVDMNRIIAWPQMTAAVETVDPKISEGCYASTSRKRCTTRWRCAVSWTSRRQQAGALPTMREFASAIVHAAGVHCTLSRAKFDRA